MAGSLTIIDELVIDEDGNITGWACAINDLEITAKIAIGDCVAPRGECPRGFSEDMECHKIRKAGEK